MSDEKMREALQASIDALDDWLNTYASDMCDQDRVEAAWKRITDNGGTLAYIAQTQQRNREALSQPAVEGWKLVPEEPTPEMWKAGARRSGIELSQAAYCWNGMLAAAPTLPEPQPVAWIRFCSDGCYEGPIADCDSRMSETRKKSGAWTPLYTLPQSEDARGAGWCPCCNGSGEETHLVGNGPDAYDQLGNCSQCGGTGDLMDAYNNMHALYIKQAAENRELRLSGLLSEKVEPVADVQNGNVRWLVDGWPDNTKLYTAHYSPTASQALRMAADVVEQHFDWAEHTCEMVVADILALIPPTESDQRKLGFAEGVKTLAAEICKGIAEIPDADYTFGEYAKETVRIVLDSLADRLDEVTSAISASTPPTDTVTREAFEEKLLADIRIIMNKYGHQCRDEADEIVEAAWQASLVANHMPKESK